MPPKRRTRGSSPKGSSGQIRQTFLDFFRDRGHTIVPSMSLVPGGDETLLFTNSGMVQFKDIFLGTGRRPYTRVVDSQKCLRVAGKHNDLDDVGRDDSHHTFFEMLGNWSFGDYYKAEAISWAWELFTEVWSLPKDRLYATCFEDELGEIPRDDEAAEQWVRQPGFDPDHVLFFGRKDNFWEMADTGPCGPDSEIHIDLGLEACNLQAVPGHTCRVNGDCTRFLELWNLVFIQYNRSGPSSLEPLPKKHVDTGLGLERLVSVLQGTGSTYRTDLFMPIIETTRGLAGHSQAQMLEHWTPYRVIADHSRAAAFLIADGVVPGNLGRNYVTRMIIRRASLFGAKLGFDEPFLGPVVQTVIEQYGEAYLELVQNRSAIVQSVTDEERRFLDTVDNAMAQVKGIFAEAARKQLSVIPGKVAFMLHSTYGLPLEIFKDLAGERGFRVDEAGFQRAMEEHRQISSSGSEEGAEAATGQWTAAHYQEALERLRAEGVLPDSGVRYDPYGDLQFGSTAAGLITENGLAQAARPGERVAVILPETHFYVEAGGQVSDTGRIVSANGRPWEIRVEDTQS
ncbi:MAG TPA: alanine--tRNA ligase, partial [Anaerolineales bacterium]|nr:alanine--tRNA ligase [Anaerolineales bacterium]